MCLLIANPENKPIPMSVFETAHESNPDGFGISFLRDGKAIIKKSVESTPDEQFAAAKKYGWPPIMHWRYSTSGATCGKFAHPFRLAPTTTIAHNGVLPIKIKKGLSDTATLVRDLRKKPFEAVKTLRELDFSGNKFVVLNTKRLHIVGEEQGEWVDGVWYSNDTGFESRYARKSSLYYNDPYNATGYDDDDEDDLCVGFIDKAVDTLSEEIEWTLAGQLSRRNRVELETLQDALDNYRTMRCV